MLYYAETDEEIEMSGRETEAFLRTFLALSNGILAYLHTTQGKDVCLRRTKMRGLQSGPFKSRNGNLPIINRGVGAFPNRKFFDMRRANNVE